MKRHPALRGLSQEHHLALVAARRLRRAAQGPPAAMPAAAGDFLRFWEASLAGHFRAEEEVLLPYAASSLPADDPLFSRMLIDHLRVRHAHLRLERALAADTLSADDLSWLGQFLDDHIRFEERRLFPAIEESLPEAELQALGASLAAVLPGCPLS